MGFRIRSWYRECERDRICPRCKKTGHGPWACSQNEHQNEQRMEKGTSYANAVTNNLDKTPMTPMTPKTPTAAPKDRWIDILTPSKTPLKKPANFVDSNPYECLSMEEEGTDKGDLLQTLKETNPIQTSTPKPKRTMRKRKATHLSTSLEEKTTKERSRTPRSRSLEKGKEKKESESEKGNKSQEPEKNQEKIDLEKENEEGNKESEQVEPTLAYGEESTTQTISTEESGHEGTDVFRNTISDSKVTSDFEMDSTVKSTNLDPGSPNQGVPLT